MPHKRIRTHLCWNNKYLFSENDKHDDCFWLYKILYAYIMVAYYIMINIPIMKKLFLTSRELRIYF
ncbi:UNVERIFIED_CONTAM: hypothetical protein NCL1_37004 [Trichonephila clavipes]